MISPEQFVAEWGQTDLIRFSPSIVNPLSIPEYSKRFLIEAGLPRNTMKYNYFDIPPNSLPRLTGLTEGYLSAPSYCTNFRVIGFHAFDLAEYASKAWEIFYCIDEIENGRVITVRADKSWETRFMSSSIPQFAEFLLIFRHNLEWRQNEWDRKSESIIAHGKEVIELLRQVDPAACHEDAAWGTLIFEIEYGM